MTANKKLSDEGCKLPVDEELAIDDPRRRRLPPLLRKAWLKLNAVFLRRISAIGLTPDQYIVLRWLTEKGDPGLTQRELSDWMVSDPNTIASLLRRMEKAGWIRRRQRPRDLRTNEVTATRTGLEIFNEARSHALALEETVLAILAEKDRKIFLALLEKVATACIQHVNASAED
ncbi:MAG: MarR family winged helix-turn-helix transcriptional regulator [Opitutales bacterium]